MMVVAEIQTKALQLYWLPNYFIILSSIFETELQHLLNI